jgi:hypothetical protein
MFRLAFYSCEFFSFYHQTAPAEIWIKEVKEVKQETLEPSVKGMVTAEAERLHVV